MSYKKRFNRRLGATNINMELDKNERFVLRQCSRYMQRHLQRKLVFDDETMTLICWLLGYDMTCIGSYLMDRMEPLQQEEFAERLQENIYEPDWYAKTLVEMMQKSGIDHFGRFRRFVREALRFRREQLQYDRRSDLETNLETIREMFNLSTPETDLCIFLFIMTSYEEPERFFDTHLHCDRFAGRKYLTHMLGLTDSELNRILCGSLVQIGILEVDSYNICIERGFLPFFQNPADRSFARDLYAPVTGSEVPLGDFLVPLHHQPHEGPGHGFPETICLETRV